MIENISSDQIKKNNDLSNLFVNAKYEDLNINCNILKSNFYLDTYNYFPINEKNNTFSSLFSRGKYYPNDHFYTDNFFKNFENNLVNFKKLNNIFLLGSNPAGNYYSNMLQFLPRLFFINEDNLKIGIHRNSSYKFRKLITQINKKKGLNFSFTYLDDDFYRFNSSKIPQFLNLKKSNVILKHFLQPRDIKKQDLKIYITRENADYRKLINEFDLVAMLKSEGYEIINPNLYEIKDQIKIFARAKKIISPHGSGLTNIVFSQPGTEIIVISPKFNNFYDLHYKNRYSLLSEYNKLQYKEIISDTVNVKKHSKTALTYINKNVLENSNNFKNLILKINDIKNLI
tara:strand:- start:31 stop:1059 length:1029 start_codon:yes stop_codon:yes gene_type:complete